MMQEAKLRCAVQKKNLVHIGGMRLSITEQTALNDDKRPFMDNQKSTHELYDATHIHQTHHTYAFTTYSKPVNNGMSMYRLFVETTFFM